MYHLATIIPAVRRIKIPLSRDQWMLLMAAINEIFLGVDIYLAHSISGTIVPREWIPIIFGPVAGVLLLLAGLIALRRRSTATVLATVVFLASIAVGVLGAYYHLQRAVLPSGPAGQQVSVILLVWAPPILGPTMFAMVGILGISAAWVEAPSDSGTLKLTSTRRLSLPYSKTRAYLFIVGMGALATVISSVLDHARSGFVNPWLWLPTGIGVFATVAAVTVAALDRPRRADLTIYAIAMVLMIMVGVIGAILHIRLNLTSESQVVVERFIRGAPILAPMLYGDIGTLGLIALLDPTEPES